MGLLWISLRIFFCGDYRCPLLPRNWFTKCAWRFIHVWLHLNLLPCLMTSFPMLSLYWLSSIALDSASYESERTTGLTRRLPLLGLYHHAPVLGIRFHSETTIPCHRWLSYEQVFKHVLYRLTYRLTNLVNHSVINDFAAYFVYLFLIRRYSNYCNFDSV